MPLNSASASPLRGGKLAGVVGAAALLSLAACGVAHVGDTTPAAAIRASSTGGAATVGAPVVAPAPALDPAITAPAAVAAAPPVTAAPAPAPAKAAVPATTATTRNAASPSATVTTAAPAKAPATTVAAPKLAPGQRIDFTTASVSAAITALHQRIPLFAPTDAQLRTFADAVCSSFDQGQTLAQVDATVQDAVSRIQGQSLSAADADFAVRTVLQLRCPGYLP